MDRSQETANGRAGLDSVASSNKSRPEGMGSSGCSDQESAPPLSHQDWTASKAQLASRVFRTSHMQDMTSIPVSLHGGSTRSQDPLIRVARCLTRHPARQWRCTASLLYPRPASAAASAWVNIRPQLGQPAHAAQSSNFISLHHTSCTKPGTRGCAWLFLVRPVPLDKICRLAQMAGSRACQHGPALHGARKALVPGRNESLLSRSLAEEHLSSRFQARGVCMQTVSQIRCSICSVLPLAKRQQLRLSR